MLWFGSMTAVWMGVVGPLAGFKTDGGLMNFLHERVGIPRGITWIFWIWIALYYAAAGAFIGAILVNFCIHVHNATTLSNMLEQCSSATAADVEEAAVADDNNAKGRGRHGSNYYVHDTVILQERFEAVSYTHLTLPTKA